MRKRNLLEIWLALWVGLSTTGFATKAWAFCDSPNLLIVLDRSGSMLNANKWTDAKTAINNVTTSHQSKIRFGLETFSDNATVDAPIPATATTIQTALNGLSPLGQTFMVKAMTTARAEITRAINADTLKDRPTSILFITDGEPSDQCPTAEVTAMRSLVVGGVTYDVKTYVIGFGSLVNRDCLNNLATQGGTALSGSIKYYVANNASDLVTAMNQIVADATKKQPEVCDNKDNDCDGKVDEGLSRSCANNKCTGTQTCSAGQWGTCSAAATQPEVCDNKDNDCDGTIDEGLTRACSYQCGASQRTGTETCSKGLWINCTAKPSTEICDNIDNDCDGQIDEGLSRACTDSVTKCKGTQTCSAGQWGTCNAAAPQPEVCDNIDNNCDGKIDENLTRSCSYNCAGTNRTGTETCKAGKWTGCTANPRSELCDNIDNDCDGQIDEGLSRSCTDSVTKCKGTQICNAGAWGTCNAAAPTTEICDKIDNDCNGKIDDGLSRACSIQCGTSTLTGTETCSNGQWINCTAKPATEVCDNKDNDCDGQVDENLSRACGKCGTQTCSKGVWGTCVEAQSTPEVCDNKDNDCDGQIDEGLKQTCQYKTCTGEQTCSKGVWSACTPPAEKCNGKDDDCDGKIDENWPDKGRVCGAGLGICYRTGIFVCKPDGSGLECNVQPGQPEVEVCDAKDNDCDGKNDEDLKRPCKEKCVEGTQECKEGSWGPCVANPGSKPPPEQCNGIDDNCDGKIDEGCTCVPGSTRPCGNGTGECKQGVQECLDTGWSNDCKGAVGPQPEVCNGKDDNCDGQIDENITRPCKTECGDGEQACIQGDWSTCSAGYPQPEICNGLDDDCDGQIDNGAVGSCGQGFGCSPSGGCRPNCRNGECPSGQQCIDNICVSQDCRGVRCPSGYQCEGAGKCVDLCTKTQCPPGLLCKRGLCLPKDCYAYGCEGGKACVDGKCVDDPCATKTCTGAQFCREGQCVDACNCQEGEICVNDKCIADPCDGKQCDVGQFCRDGNCEKACATACHDGQFCKDGQCVHNPCYRTECPVGTQCFEGQCTNVIPKRQPPLLPDGATPDGGNTNPDQGGNPNPDNGNPTGTDENGNTQKDDPIGGTDKVPDTNLEPGTGNDGNGAAVGCGCNFQRFPIPSAFLMLFLFVLLLGRLGFKRR